MPRPQTRPAPICWETDLLCQSYLSCLVLHRFHKQTFFLVHASGWIGSNLFLLSLNDGKFNADKRCEIKFAKLSFGRRYRNCQHRDRSREGGGRGGRRQTKEMFYERRCWQPLPALEWREKTRTTSRKTWQHVCPSVSDCRHTRSWETESERDRESVRIRSVRAWHSCGNKYPVH